MDPQRVHPGCATRCHIGRDSDAQLPAASNHGTRRRMELEYQDWARLPVHLRQGTSHASGRTQRPPSGVADVVESRDEQRSFSGLNLD